MLYIVSEVFHKNKVDIILISNTRYSLQIVADNMTGMADKVFKEINEKFQKSKSIL